MISWQNISTIRQRWGYSQAQLGAMLHVGRDIIANWESGRVPVPFLAIAYLAQVTGLSVEYLQESAIIPADIPAAPLLEGHASVVERLEKIEQKLDAIASELRVLRDL